MRRNQIGAPIASTTALAVRQQRRGLVLLVVAMLSASGGFATAGASHRAPDGTYSTEQQRRGERVYRRSCAKCHLTDLSGGDPTGAADSEVPPALAGPEFFDRWKSASVGALVLTVKRSMPQDAPGTLTIETAVDLVSYLLAMNGMPPGDGDLPTAIDKLEAIVIGEAAPRR
jgi:mono/diheme cytochrome c family protein